MWIPFHVDFKVQSTKPSNCPLRVVSDLIVKSAYSWNRVLIDSIFSEKESVAMQDLPISMSNVQDSLVWNWFSNWIYSVKSGYFEALKSIGATWWGVLFIFQPPLFWNKVWSVPKIKFFMWSAIHNAVATKENLFSSECYPSPMCPVWESEIESIEHVLMRCDRALAIWEGAHLFDLLLLDYWSAGSWVEEVIHAKCNFWKEWIFFLW